MKNNKEFICCICNAKIRGEYGNDPAPLRGSKCCDTCNSQIVIPVRLFVHTIVGAIKDLVLICLDCFGFLVCELLHTIIIADYSES